MLMGSFSARLTIPRVSVESSKAYQCANAFAAIGMSATKSDILETLMNSMIVGTHHCFNTQYARQTNNHNVNCC